MSEDGLLGEDLATPVAAAHVSCLQASPKLLKTLEYLEVGLKPTRDNGSMVVGNAAAWTEKCSHETSIWCSSGVAVTLSWRIETLNRL